jgi:tRNA (guanine37-N1)-methyltransferase
MRISIITLFPEVFEPILNSSILKRAQNKGKVEFELINLRDFGEGRHQVVDGRVYGGGAGMLLRADILAKAVDQCIGISVNQKKPLVILTSASGKTYNQAKARALSKLEHIVIVCGRYEGVDQRFIDQYVDEEISIGDYVLTGGEIPAMIIVDSITRLIPGVLEKEEATINESFTENTLEGPQYTRPEEFEGQKVPEVLLSGHHGEVEKWRKQKSLEKTQKVRPDLITEKD